MQKPMGRIETIAASATAVVPGLIPLVRARTLTITARILFGASIDANATIKVFYSPDGNRWDSLPYTTQAVTYTVSVWVQKTIIVDPPEHGHISISITNGSSADAIDGVEMFYSIQSWPDFPAQSRGLIDTAEVYD